MANFAESDMTTIQSSATEQISVGDEHQKACFVSSGGPSAPEINTPGHNLVESKLHELRQDASQDASSPTDSSLGELVMATKNPPT